MHMETDNKTTAIVLSYAEDYRILDEALPEAFIVYRAVNIGRPAWWNGEVGRQKVLRLIDGFKADLLNEEAFIFAGITTNQYRSFCTVHATFPLVKARCKRVMEISAKIGLAIDMKNPKESKARQWFLERKQPDTYGRNIGSGETAPPVGAAVRITAEAFVDQDGKMIISKQLAEDLIEDGTDNDTSN